MYKIFCRSKIQNLKVDKVDSNLDFPLLLNKKLLKSADILEGERVQVLNSSSGGRVFAYIKSSHSNRIIVGKPLSRWIREGDKITILSYVFINSSEKLKYKTKVINLSNREQR